MKRIQLTTGLDDAWLKLQEGHFFDHRHFDRVLPREAVDVFKPNGDPLLLYRPQALALTATHIFTTPPRR